VVDSRHHARARSGAGLHLVPGTSQNAAAAADQAKSTSFRRYPLWRVLCLNGLTLVQYTTGSVAIALAYPSSPLLGLPVAAGYFVFAMVQLYVLMPLIVCPGCVYRTISDGRCASGLSVISARLCAPSVAAAGFEERVHGALCQSSLCLWSLVLPVPLALPGLALWFTWLGLGLTVGVAVLAVVRLVVIARRSVCSHCLARRWCPAARSGRRVF
jgi:hypothetical protein